MRKFIVLIGLCLIPNVVFAVISCALHFHRACSAEDMAAFKIIVEEQAAAERERKRAEAAEAATAEEAETAAAAEAEAAIQAGPAKVGCDKNTVTQLYTTKSNECCFVGLFPQSSGNCLVKVGCEEKPQGSGFKGSCGSVRSNYEVSRSSGWQSFATCHGNINSSKLYQPIVGSCKTAVKSSNPFSSAPFWGWSGVTQDCDFDKDSEINAGSSVMGTVYCSTTSELGASTNPNYSIGAFPVDHQSFHGLNLSNAVGVVGLESRGTSSGVSSRGETATTGEVGGTLGSE
ncbi:MAG: hypothetical protein HOE90_23210 [Bacteriovoracaceae bacterium]|nr:hypothetical protein [Bacteriovoracaceae bacterium]